MKKLFPVFFLFGFLASASTSDFATAQFVKERARRLSKSGRLESTPVRFFPVAPGDGVIISDVIRGSGSGAIKALRLHFTFNAAEVRRAGQDGTWKVNIKNLEGLELWEFDSESESDFEEFWSPQLPAAAVQVTITSTVPNSVLKLTCDKRIEHFEPIQERSIVGDDDSIEITRVTDQNHLRWGRSVARLTFISHDYDEALTCTGFLVAANLFITNDHCPRGEQERKSAIVEFDYDVENARTKIYRLKTELIRDEVLDFAFYELNKPVNGRDFLRLAAEPQPLENQKPLLIIQHPAGLPKRLAAFKCHVRVPSGAVQPPTDFGHECDTQGGSSGSPVQNIAGLVIGIHHFGFDPEVTDPEHQVNQAVKMYAIIAFVRSQARSHLRSKSLKAKKVLNSLQSQ